MLIGRTVPNADSRRAKALSNAQTRTGLLRANPPVDVAQRSLCVCVEPARMTWLARVLIDVTIAELPVYIRESRETPRLNAF
jgi:hypothetical protein